VDPIEAANIDVKTNSITDPVLVQREKIRKRVKLGKRVGYSLMLTSIITMFLCLPLGWPAYLTITSMVTFTLSCIVLPLPIIFGYAIKAAEKEDRKIGFK